MSLFESKSNDSHGKTFIKKLVHLLLTVKEMFSLLFMRAVAVNPNVSYSLVRHQDKTYISSSQSVNHHSFFKNKKIHKIRKFMGQALIGISVANPIDNSIICPVLGNSISIHDNAPGINAVCPLAYQDDLNIIEGVSVDRREIFDKFGRTNLDLYGNAGSQGIFFVF